jgi:hypothetical protein
MSQRQEDGYILASVLAVLLTVSLVAAALVSTSAGGLKDVKEAEANASADAALHSALLVVSDQLSLDPRRRKLDIDRSDVVIDVLGRKISVRAAWEITKVDVNLANLEEIEEALVAVAATDTVRSEIRAAVQQSRAEKAQIAFLDNILPSLADRDCLHSILTVFGGSPEYRPEDEATPVRIGRPAAGAKVVVEVWLAEDFGQPGLEAVLLMTGDPARPSEVLDWRRIRSGGEERCNV